MISCQAITDCNWSVIPPLYEDYSLTDERKLEIKNESDLLISNMKQDLKVYAQDPLTNEFGYHITGTLEQGLSDKWHGMRVHKVTASVFIEWIISAISAMKRLP